MTTICGWCCAAWTAAVWICLFETAALFWRSELNMTVLTPWAFRVASVVSTGGSANGSATSGYAAVCRWLAGRLSTQVANDAISSLTGRLTLKKLWYVFAKTRPPVAEPASSAYPCFAVGAWASEVSSVENGASVRFTWSLVISAL